MRTVTTLTLALALWLGVLALGRAVSEPPPPTIQTAVRTAPAATPQGSPAVGPPPLAERAASPVPAPYARTLAPGEVVRAVTLEQAAAAYASGGPVLTVLRIAWCEGGLDPAARVEDDGGTPSVGTGMVKAEYWGPVPPDLAGQLRQVAGIHAGYGEKPWSRPTCDEFNLR